MVNYPDLSNLNNGSGIAGIMSLPNSSYPFFWGWILGGIWVIISLTLFFKEKETLGKVKILGSLAVASFAVVVLATVGTVLGIITNEIMVPALVFSLIFIAIWFFSSK